MELRLKNKLIVVLILLSFILPIGKVFAIENVTKITIHEAINIALENSIDLQAEKINTEIAKNLVKQAGRLQNPSFGANYNIGKSAQGNPQEIGISQTVELFKRKNRKKLANTDLELAQENVDYAVFNLKMNIKEAYIDLVAAKSILESLMVELKSLQEIDKLVKLRHKQGTATETDVIQADIALNHLTTQVNSAIADVMSARFTLNSVMDTDPIYDSTVESFDDGDFFAELMTPHPKDPIPTYIQAITVAQENRHDLKIAKTKIQSAQDNLKLVSAQRIPDIELSAGYGYQSKNNSESGKFENGAYASANLVNLPILYNFKPEIQNAKLEIEKAELKYSSLQNNAFANLSSAYERFIHAKLNLNYYSDTLIENSKQMMKTSKENYEQGKTDLTSLIIIEQSYRSILIGYAYALSKYYTSWLDLVREVHVEDFVANSEYI